MRQRIGVALALTIPLAAPSPARGQQSADVLLVDAVIHTMDPERPEAEALAVVGGEIVALGASSELIARYRGPDTEVIEAGGATVLPGLIDAHGHVMGLGRALRILDLVGTESAEEIAEIARKLRKDAEALKAEYEAKAKSAEKEAASIVERAKHDAEAIVAQAKLNAEALVERRQRMAEEKIAAEERAAVEKLRATAADAAREAAARIIRERVDASADEALVGEAIRSIGSR